MGATNFIAAIELGSTKITAAAGTKDADGNLQILAYAEVPASNCIKRGIIYNLDKTTQGLSSIIKQLEDKLQAPIKKVYVGVGGQSIQTILNTETKTLNEATKVSQALIDSMMRDNRKKAPIDREILAVEPQEYKIGNNLLTEPIGIPANHIEGHFLNIIGKNTLKSNIKQCIRQAGYEVADYLLSPLVTADAILTDSEKRSGCALIDFGASTTTVSVYKNNLLRHLAVIPLGSNNITKDICSLQIEEDDAEQLKLKYASAYTETTNNNDETKKEYSIDGHCNILALKLEDIVESRVKEIIENIQNQITHSEYNGKLMAGVVFTGGGSNLPNLEKAFTNITKIDKVRIARTANVKLTGETNLPQDGTQNTLIGLLYAGKENCCKIDSRNDNPTIFDEIKKNEEMLKECDQLILEATKALNGRNYAEALQKLDKASGMNLNEKKESIQQLKEEIKAKEKEAAQEKQEQLNTFEQLMQEAKQLMQKKNHKAALAKIEQAQQMNLPDKEEEIKALEEEIKKQKKENKWLSKIFGQFEDIMKDEEK